jgi:23S rRNA pseudouridine2605 synthase
VRVQKILAAAGFGSRRGAEELIRDGRVTVNGRTVELGATADPRTDVVALDGERIQADPLRYWVLHKPRGVVTTLADPQGRRHVRQLLPREAGRLHPVGRLDRESSGLLLLTNDGALTQRLLHPSHGGEKEYRVTAKGEVGEKALAALRHGVVLDDGRTAPAKVEQVRYDRDADTTQLHLVLTEGRKRQIRRAMLVLGHPVKRLVRVRVGPIRLGHLAPGAARPLRGDEIRALRAYAERLAVRPSRPGRAAGRRGPAGSRA